MSVPSSNLDSFATPTSPSAWSDYGPHSGAASASYTEPAPDQAPTDELPLVISFGCGMRLVSPEHVAVELASVGIDAASLDLLLNALAVPCLHINGRRLFDFYAFIFALKSALRPGSPDLHVSGPLPPNLLNSVTSRATYANDIPDLVAELLAVRHLTTLRPVHQSQLAADAIRDAITSLRRPNAYVAKDTPSPPVPRRQRSRLSRTVP